MEEGADMNISTKLIYDAIKTYEGLGYQMVDVPLVVDRDVSNHTKPEGVPELSHLGDKVYVASAEQSFIQLHKEGKLPRGKYMALTPCHRHERFLDEEHYLIFLKLELIVVGLWKKNPLFEMVDSCTWFFNRTLDHEVKMEGNFAFGEMDLTCEGVELGSYGSRNMLDGTPYYYGTGIAEPRLSYVKSLVDNQK